MSEKIICKGCLQETDVHYTCIFCNQEKCFDRCIEPESSYNKEYEFRTCKKCEEKIINEQYKTKAQRLGVRCAQIFLNKRYGPYKYTVSIFNPETDY